MGFNITFAQYREAYYLICPFCSSTEVEEDVECSQYKSCKKCEEKWADIIAITGIKAEKIERVVKETVLKENEITSEEKRDIT